MNTLKKRLLCTLVALAGNIYAKSTSHDFFNGLGTPDNQPIVFWPQLRSKPSIVLGVVHPGSMGRITVPDSIKSIILVDKKTADKAPSDTKKLGEYMRKYPTWELKSYYDPTTKKFTFEYATYQKLNSSTRGPYDKRTVGVARIIHRYK